jgi:WD40 repeat protein
VLSIGFSNDGKLLAASGWEDTTKVWDVESGKELFYRNGHNKSVTGVLFNADNTRLITAGIDQTVKVWEMPKK